MSDTTIATAGPLVLVGAPTGEALISYGTPLTRLNYFDGKFLRADDLNGEQAYLRSLVHLSNQAGGTGVVHGFTAALGADGLLDLSPGLAIDPAGRVLLLGHAARVDLAALIEKSRETSTGAPSTGAGTPPSGAMGEGFAPCADVSSPAPGATTTFPTDLYLLALCHAEALCGEEDVYGKLCEDACVTSTDRPYRKEGVMLRALPLTLCPPTCDASWLDAKHRRSRVASAYFATERALLGRAMSGTRLGLDLWCRGAAAEGGTCVPIAVVSMAGGTVDFLDAWTARRERMDAPPRRYWAWQTMMRPWSVYLAQVLQFQCHLHDVLGHPGTTPGGPDPCAPKSDALRDAVALLEEMERSYAAAMTDSGSDVFRPDFLTRVADLRSRVSGALTATPAPEGTRILVDGGIVELPPAGYLPVVPGGTSVNDQVRALLGGGVDLRFCVVRPDYVAHALEETQHMERICLLEGIEHPDRRPEVDVLVPDGTVERVPAPRGRFFETDFMVMTPDLSVRGEEAAEEEEEEVRDPTGAAPMGTNQPAGVNSIARDEVFRAPAMEVDASTRGPRFRGAGRSEALPTGGGAYHFAGILTEPVEQVAVELGRKYRTVEMNERTNDGSADMLGGVDLNGMAAAAARMAREKGGGEARTLQPALWTTLRCERDPFALRVGESTPIKLEASAGASVLGYLLGGTVVLQGDLFCDEISGGSAGPTVRGRAWGWAYAHARVEQGGNAQSHAADPTFVPVTAELSLRPDTAGGGELVATVLSQQGIELTITTRWTGGPVRALSAVTLDLVELFRAAMLRRADTDQARAAVDANVARLEQARPHLRSVQIARARLVENAEVGDDANPHHAMAARALRTIGAALADEGWQRTAERLLFPPAEPALETRVLPTRDWVLFHRRRRSSCDCCVPETRVPEPPRRYRLYEATGGPNTTLEEIRNGLARGEDLRAVADFVGVVEFEGGTARITDATNPAQIRQGWTLAAPAASIVYGAIASEGAALADPDELDEQRVGRAADLVRSVTPLVSTAPFDVLPLVPNGLSADGLDGVIILVTVPAGTQTHRVVSFRDQGMMSFVMERIGRGELAAVIDENDQILGGVPEVAFAAGTDTVADGSLDSVRATWDARWSTAIRVARALVVLPASGAIDRELAERQGDRIAGGMRGNLTEATMTSSEDVFGGAVAIILLEPSQRGQ